ncbi:MAG: ATP-binding cassette domain-containing protein, partial [Treponema sp.]|nr:ATP-binding cassette domain-containing protein [Treponema sp.]
MKNISFSYENELVLKNIDFALQQGTLTALTGISGSGKTTLLELAEGLLVPKNGKVFSIGRPVLCMQNNEDSFSNLSSGEQKLVSIKSACDTDADILLFDEPTSFLDAKE